MLYRSGISIHWLLYLLAVWARLRWPAEFPVVWLRRLWRQSWILRRPWSTQWPHSPVHSSTWRLPPSAAPANTDSIIQRQTEERSGVSPKSSECIIWGPTRRIHHKHLKIWVWVVKSQTMLVSSLLLPWRQRSVQPWSGPSDMFLLPCRCHGDTA